MAASANTKQLGHRQVNKYYYLKFGENNLSARRREVGDFDRTDFWKAIRF